jgi:UDP-glucose 4-epimerase
VDDIVDGLITVAFKGTGECEEYCIGSKEAYSIIEIANMIGGNIEYQPERRGNRNSADIDTSKLEKLGWKQRKNLKDYIIQKIS